jgi:S1-C subfamily serine protease
MTPEDRMRDHQEPWAGHDAGMPAPPGFTPPPGTPPARKGRWMVGLGALLAALIVAVTLVGLNLGTHTSAIPTISSSSGTITAPTTVGSVVNIDTSLQGLDGGGMTPLGAGSGMVLTTDGEILTNNHVVEGASRISVSIPGEGTAVAKVVGVDPSDDIALLQISGMNGLDPVSIGDSSSVAVGDQVTAIGNAYGKGGSPTVVHGSVTAVHRSIRAGDPGSSDSEQLNDVIEISANVVPGDSGGALLDANGHVIGIITAGPSQGGTSIGYAIPIGAAIDIVNEIRAGHGSSTILIGERGFLGVSVKQLDATTAAQLGLSDTSGVLVIGVEQGSPAAKLGITAPAVIRSIDGTQINSEEDLGAALHVKTPGQTVDVRWVDGLGSHSGTATLAGGGPAV